MPVNPKCEKTTTLSIGAASDSKLVLFWPDSMKRGKFFAKPNASAKQHINIYACCWIETIITFVKGQINDASGYPPLPQETTARKYSTVQTKPESTAVNFVEKDPLRMNMLKSFSIRSANGMGSCDPSYAHIWMRPDIL